MQANPSAACHILMGPVHVNLATHAHSRLYRQQDGQTGGRLRPCNETRLLKGEQSGEGATREGDERDRLEMGKKRHHARYMLVK